MMKRLLRWVVIVCVLLLVLVAAALVLKDPILRKVTESRIASETGLKTTLGALHVSMRSGTVTVTDFKLLNDPEFGGTCLMHVPEIHLALDAQQASEGKLRFSEVRFNLAQVNIVRATNGTLNLDSLKKKHRDRQDGSGKKSGRDFEFTGIDRLQLTLGSIQYTDLQNPKLNNQHILGVTNEVINDIKSEEELQAHVLRLLLRSALAELMNPAERKRSKWLRDLLRTLK